MPNAFTLFGRLDIDTNKFERSLHDAEVRLNQMERAVTKTEQAARRAGQTSATSARGFEKLTDSIKDQRTRLMEAVDAYSKGTISHSKFMSEMRRTDTTVNRVGTRLGDMSARIKDLNSRTSEFAGTWIPRLNTMLAGAAIGAAYFGIKATASFESMKNRLEAATGSGEGALKMMTRLRDLSLRNVGVDVEFAAFTFSQLKANTKLAEDGIFKVVKALGLLRAANPLIDTTKYVQNLQQLFNQNFERQDVKEAVGNNPRFFAQLEKAFGTQDIDAIKKMKASGKLTAEAFYDGMAEAVLRDEAINRLTDTPIQRIQKAWSLLTLDIGDIGDGLLKDFDGEIQQALTGIANKDYSAAGDGIGQAIGRAIGKGIKSGLDSEMGEGGDVGFLDSIGIGIQKGMNADNATTAIQIFFNKIGFEVTSGIVDLAALVASLDPALNISDKIMEMFGFDQPSNNVAERVKSEFREMRKSLEAEYADNALALLEQSRQHWEGVANDTSASDAVREQARKQIAAIEKEMAVVRKRMEEALNAAELEKQSQQYASVLVTTTEQAVTAAAPVATSSGLSLGEKIAIGMSSGIYAGQSGVITAAITIALAAYNAAKTALGIASPSKRFRELGVNVGEGFALGITSMEPHVQAAMKKIVTMKAIEKEIAKQIKDLQKSLGETLIGNQATSSGYGRMIGFDVELFKAEGMKKTLDDLKRLRLELGINVGKPLIIGPQAEGELTRLTTISDKFASITDDIKEMREAKLNPVEEFIKFFASKETTQGLAKAAAALNLTADAFKNLAIWSEKGKLLKDLVSLDIGSGRAEMPNDGKWRGLGPSPDEIDAAERTQRDKDFWEEVYNPVPAINMVKLLDMQWENFWNKLKSRMEEFKSSLPSLKTALGENLGASLESISGMLASNLTRWEGGFKGMFMRIGQGFAQMAQQIAAEMIRLMIFKALLRLFGSLAGSIGGGAAVGGAHEAASSGGFASGGAVFGAGTGTSDSIFARLSNGEYVMKAAAVRHWGADLLDRMNNMTLGSPSMAFAGGGMVGGGSTSSYDYSSRSFSPIFNINVSGSASPEQNRQTGRQIGQAAIARLREFEQQSK